ncbi:MAG: Do family serine endopeptidase [Nitrospirae bacterium]|nr:Do family serine endopeptidase [Nitrospirota bacterium]
MRKKVFIGIAFLLLGFLLGGIAFYVFQKPAPQIIIEPKVSGQAEGKGISFSDVVSSASPSVVNISTVKVLSRSVPFSDDPFFEFFNEFFSPFYDSDIPRKWKEQGLGSGVIVSPDGYIITNNHVVSDAERIKVTLFDKRTFKADIVGADPKTDIAVLKISASALPVIPWGDSDKLRVGEFVLAIGNPFGLNHTVTMGIISAVGRANVGIAEYEDFIQTDAAINPGNSGGPLVDTSGNLIGINTAIFTKSGGYQGVGFAVPSNMARLLMEQLLKEGKIIRGWLGVTIQELTPELSQKFGYETEGGALVGEAMSGSPAEKAGIRRGDIIVQYDGKDVSSPSVLKNLVARNKPGKQVTVKLFRNKRFIDVVVTVGEPPAELSSAQPTNEKKDSRKSAFSGLSVMELTKDIARQLSLDMAEGGVVVVKVSVGTPSEDAGLKRGDVIHEIDGKRIRNIEDFNRITYEIKTEETVLMYITRGNRKFYITVFTSS